MIISVVRECTTCWISKEGQINSPPHPPVESHNECRLMAIIVSGDHRHRPTHLCTSRLAQRHRACTSHRYGTKYPCAHLDPKMSGRSYPTRARGRGGMSPLPMTRLRSAKPSNDVKVGGWRGREARWHDLGFPLIIRHVLHERGGRQGFLF